MLDNELLDGSSTGLSKVVQEPSYGEISETVHGDIVEPSSDGPGVSSSSNATDLGSIIDRTIESKSPSKRRAPYQYEGRKIEPLSWWKPAEKDWFNSLDAQSQKNVLNMYNGVQKVYEHKTRLVAQREAQLGRLTAVLAPLMPLFERKKVAPEAYIERLLSVDRYSAEQPANYVVDFMDANKLSIDHLIYAISTLPQRRKELQMQVPVYNEIAQLKQSMAKKNYEEAYRRNQMEVEEFKTAVDEEGNILHPYMDELEPYMLEEYRRTRNWNLEKLYEAAVYMHPKIREYLAQAREAPTIDRIRNAANVYEPSRGADVSPGRRATSVGDAFEQAFKTVNNRY